jgi:hypothetical protein
MKYGLDSLTQTDMVCASGTCRLVTAVPVYFKVNIVRNPASGGYKYRGPVLRDGGWAWG